MGADMHIHVLEGIEESELEGMFYNHLGSKYCPLTRFDENTSKEDAENIFKEIDVLHEKYGNNKYGEGSISDRVEKTPQVWVGEVSWLKAGLTGDDKYIPEPVSAISDIIGEELPVIDDELIDKIREALGMKNTTGYKTTTHAKEVIKFLKKHRGKKVFTVSW